MIVLDASVVIAHLDRSDASHFRATQVLSEHASEAFLMSVITRAEILVRPAHVGVLERVESALDLLPVTTFPLEAETTGRLARIRADTGLRLSDCCVVLAAERSNAGVGTFDDRLATVARDRGLRVIA